MTRSPAELEPEIEASRQALAADVAALKARATPRRLMSDVAEKARERGRRTGARLLKVASSESVWLSVVGGAILAGGGAFLLKRLIAGRQARRDTVAANMVRLAEPIGAALAGGAAWMATRGGKVARHPTVKTVVARASDPVGLLLRRASRRRQGIRAFLPMLP